MRDLVDRVGRRGAALLLFAVIDLIIGWSMLGPVGEQLRAVPAYRAAVAVAPPCVWAGVWITVGLICLSQSPRRRDWPGFAAAVAVKAVWGGCFLYSWLVFRVDRAWVGAVTWGLVAGLVFVISGWPEPRRRGAL